MGLRNALLNFRQYEESHITENIIVNELCLRGYNVDVGMVKVKDRDCIKHSSKQLEVDFVANLGSRRYYIQSALDISDIQKLNQEQASLINIPDSFKKLIVVRGRTPLWHNEQGIMIINIFDFLLKENSLEL